jgi:hypothetical protein
MKFAKLVSLFKPAAVCRTIRPKYALWIGFAIISAGSLRASSPDDLPFRGLVVNPFNIPVAAFAVRDAAPSASATSYKLGLFLCAAFSSNTLYATDERQIANGEVWYHVQIETSSSRPSECSAGATGWMVGRLKDGSQVVQMITRRVEVPKVRQLPTQELRKKEVATSGEQPPHTFWWYYIFLVMGTFLTTIILTWERNRDVNLAPLMKRLVIVEFVSLGIANVIILVLVIPLWCSIDTTSPVALVLQKSTQRPDGHFILGFVLSVLLLKSISFAKDSH